MTKELQGRIKEMIAQGKPQEAVRLLELNTNSPKLQKQIILISSRLETLHQKVGKGIISSPEETLERNIINDALITLVNKHDDGQGFGSRKKFLTVGLLSCFRHWDTQNQNPNKSARVFCSALV